MSTEALPAPPRLGLPWEPRDRAPLTGEWWARGLNLAERIAAPGTPAPAPADSELAVRAAKRLAHWRAAHAEAVTNALQAQLTGMGLTEAQLLALLAEDPAALAARAKRPAWADEVYRVVAEMPETAATLPAASGWAPGFGHVVRPFVTAATRQLAGTGALDRARPVIDVASFVAAFESALTAELVTVAAKALVLELNVRRVLGGLAGDDAEARFQSFVRHLTVPDNFAYFLDEYVVLARTMATLAGFAARAQAEFCDRFVADRALAVGQILGGRDHGELVEVSLGGGDTHGRGRAVALLRFASGARLAYKPRPLTVHGHFNDVVGWYNGLLPGLDLRRLAVVDRGEYGWIEFADADECDDADGARRYFRRSGALLALLYALGGTDFHHENVIAAGDQPVLIDLEALCHAELPTVAGPRSLVPDPAALAHRDSVNRIGLLPAVVTGPDGDALDIGGMGADGGFLAPFETVDWSAAGTDEMRLTRTRKMFRGSRNRPRLDGVALDPCRYLDDFQTGFREGYLALLRQRAALTAADGLLSRFAGARNRLVARATRTYMQLLTESYHPDVARDALDREWVFGLLWALPEGDPQWTQLVPHEVADLWNGDVPMFQGTIGSRDLTAVSGDVVPDVLATSGSARARRIVDRMSDADLGEQEWIIDATMATRSPARAIGSTRAAAPWSSTVDDGRPVAERAQTQAIRIGELLAASACQEDGRVGWLGLELVAETSWAVAPLRFDLYSGLPGVAIFFAELAAVSGEQRYADLARGALAGTVSYVETITRPGFPRTGVTCGGFDGLGGVAYALDTVATLLQDPDLAAPVVLLLDLATELIGDDTHLDLVGGAAGSLTVAESLAARYGAAATRLAGRAAELLCARSVLCGPGVGWLTPISATSPLLGMSHGASGVGLALLRHAAHTGDELCARIGYAAMDYERSEFRADGDNWPDYRVAPTLPWETAAPDTVSFMHAWCHGAPGIGLARAAVPEPLRTPGLMRDLEIAVRSTAAQPVATNHSLCHGSLGNLELFAHAAAAGVAAAAETHRRHAEAIVAQVERTGPRCGTPLAVRTPGLMAGLAGIGHGLLRIAAPQRIAPVLLLGSQR